MSPNGFSGLGTATISSFFGNLWNFELAHASSEEVGNQDLRADPAWSMNSGRMESNPGDFSSFRRLRAAASSSGLKAKGFRTEMITEPDSGRSLHFRLEQDSEPE